MTALWKNLLRALLLAGGLQFLFLAARSAAAVKAASTPTSAGLARIPEFLELWNETAGYAVFGLALMSGA